MFCPIRQWCKGESPSLVLVINDTKLLLPSCQVNWVRRSNTCDEGARNMMVMAIRSQVHGDKDNGEYAHRWWTRNEMIKVKGSSKWLRGGWIGLFLKFNQLHETSQNTEPLGRSTEVPGINVEPPGIRVRNRSTTEFNEWKIDRM
jgi:hypothetical protein